LATALHEHAIGAVLAPAPLVKSGILSLVYQMTPAGGAGVIFPLDVGDGEGPSSFKLNYDMRSNTHHRYDADS